MGSRFTPDEVKSRLGDLAVSGRTAALRLLSPVERLTRALTGGRDPGAGPVPPLWLRRHAGPVGDFHTSGAHAMALLERLGLLGPDQLAGVKSGKLDRPTRMAIEAVSTSDADLEGANRWYAVTARGASGKDIRQLFERQGALVSRVMRISMGSLALDKALSRGQYRQLEEDEIDALLNPPADAPAED